MKEKFARTKMVTLKYMWGFPSNSFMEKGINFRSFLKGKVNLAKWDERKNDQRFPLICLLEGSNNNGWERWEEELSRIFFFFHLWTVRHITCHFAHMIAERSQTHKGKINVGHAQFWLKQIKWENYKLWSKRFCLKLLL